MRTRRLLSVCTAVTTGYLLILLHAHVQATDKPDPEVATIEFQDIPGRPPQAYDLKWTIELVGTAKKFRTKNSYGARATAPLLAAHFDTVLKEIEGLQYKLNTDGKSLTVRGWKDPKTGKFYPVKRMILESKTMPKGVIPKITSPKLPAA